MCSTIHFPFREYLIKSVRNRHTFCFSARGPPGLNMYCRSLGRDRTTAGGGVWQGRRQHRTRKQQREGGREKDRREHRRRTKTPTRDNGPITGQGVAHSQPITHSFIAPLARLCKCKILIPKLKETCNLILCGRLFKTSRPS